MCGEDAILASSEAMIKNVRKRADRVRRTATMSRWDISRDHVTSENQ